MAFSRAGASMVSSLCAGIMLLACAPGEAMQSATPQSGFSWGGSIGESFGKGTSAFTIAPDIDYGVHTGALGFGYTGIVADGVLFFTKGSNVSLATLGLLQQIGEDRGVALSVEGGLSYLKAGSSATGLTGTSTSEFGGIRVTHAQSPDLSVNGMFRYHFQGSGFWQAGIGLSGGLNNRLGWQLDYYHFKSSLNTIAIGLRWPWSPGPARAAGE